VIAAFTTRRVFVTASLALFALVFAADAMWERPGLGIGHFFYIAIALLALAGGARLGALAGLTGTGFYAVAILVDPHIAPREVLTFAMAIRAVTFTLIGALIGWYAGSNRRLVAELRVLAQRDQLTGLPNTRAFEAAITRRLDAGKPFALLLGDMDALMAINREQGQAHGNDVLRALAELLSQALGPEDEIARVGGDEFAVVAPLKTSAEAARLAARLERIATEQSPITFGWSSFPQDGENALSLYRAADERLYARKLVRGRRLGDAGAQLRAVTR
jgi:diguanylate cyclase (GGDEF)-like protein